MQSTTYGFIYRDDEQEMPWNRAILMRIDNMLIEIGMAYRVPGFAS